MRCINRTPFPALNFEAEDQSHQSFDVVVARTTWEITPNGTLVVAANQQPLLFEDEDWPQSAMAPYNGKEVCTRQESDLAPYKPKTDIIVLANGCAPGGRPAKRWAVGVRVLAPSRSASLIAPQQIPRGSGKVILHKTIMVTGPRWWEKRPVGWALTEPQRAMAVPLTYAYAYGGEIMLDRHEDRVAAQQQSVDAIRRHPGSRLICEANPAGRGHAPTNAPRPILQLFDAIGRIPAPQLESAEDPIREWGRTYTPVGFGALGRTWTHRYRHVGSFQTKASYGAKEFPSLPSDFDSAYWNVAHPDMQVPHLVGDETIHLLNCCPHDIPGAVVTTEGQLLTIRLPGDHLYLRVEDAFGRIGVKSLVLDTAVLDPAERRVTLLWRCTLPARAMIKAAQLRHCTAQSKASNPKLSEFAALRLAMIMAQDRVGAQQVRQQNVE